MHPLNTFPNLPETATDHDNTGNTLIIVQNNSLESVQRVFRSANSYSSIASIYREQGNHEKALEYYETSDYCGVRDAAREHGLEDESVTVQVAAFVDDMTQNGSIRDRYDSGTDWDALEEAHGDLADQYC